MNVGVGSSDQGEKKETTDFRPRKFSYSFKKCQPGIQSHANLRKFR